MERLKLTSSERRRLERQLHQTQDARVYRRTLAVLENGRGRSVAQIAEALGVTRQGVYNWLAAYAVTRDPCALMDEPRPGRPRLWTHERQALLNRLLETSPDRLGYLSANWTVPLLQEHIERATGLRVSDDTIRRGLHAGGYAWKRPRYVLRPDPDREKKTLHRMSGAQIEQAGPGDGAVGGG